MGLKLSGAQGVGHCGPGGAQAKWLWNSEAGLMLMLTLMLIFDDDDEDLFWPRMMTNMMMMVMLGSGWSMQSW